MPFENGFDFNLWGWMEWTIVGVLLLLVILLLVLLFKPKKKVYKPASQPAPKQDARKEDAPTPKEESPKQEAPAAKPAEEKVAVEKEAPSQDAPSTKPAAQKTPAAKKEKDSEDKVVKYHVSQNKDKDSEFNGQWRVRKQGSQKTIKYFKTQAEAIKYAESLAENNDTSIVIHKRDGSIRKQDYSKKK